MLYIIRHGKTDWNVWHKLQGRTDIPLNEEGRQMAEAARKEYRDVHFDICFCSPLIRAKETAEIFLRSRNIPIITDDRLMEMSFGCFEGIENSFQIPDCPVNELFFHPDQYIAPPDGGENLITGLKKMEADREIPALYSVPLIRYLKLYYLIGGMPEAVKKWVETHQMEKVIEIQDEILQDYADDFGKHAPVSEIPKIRMIWDSILLSVHSLLPVPQFFVTYVPGKTATEPKLKDFTALSAEKPKQLNS